MRRLGAHGVKCYHTLAPTLPTWEADIPDYLPEPIVQIAHEERLVITLHMVRARAVADQGGMLRRVQFCAIRNESRTEIFEKFSRPLNFSFGIARDRTETRAAW